MSATTLADVRSEPEGRVYPRARLKGCEDALILFSSAFNGKQDAYWIADAGLRGTCIDHDHRALTRMAPLYPNDWDFVQADVYEWAVGARAAGLEWDVVSLDVPTGQFQRAATMLPLWCQLARKLVVLGTGTSTRVPPLEGWRETGRRRRSDYAGGVYWTTLEPA